MTEPEERRRITRNALRCRNCDTVIESKFRHDFQSCPCGDAFIDGGLDYVRCGFRDAADVEVLTEYAEDTK